MPTLRARLTMLALAGATLCAIAAPAGAQKRDRDVLTRDEILASAQKDADLFQAIRSLRPNFFTGVRGTTSLMKGRAQIAVYIEGGRRNDTDALKQILASEVAEVRHLSPSQAETEYGVDHNAGAIVVKLYHGGKPNP